MRLTVWGNWVMHEMYLTECIIDSVKKSLPKKISPDAVTEVQVQVGELDAVIPETLIFLFDAIKGSHGLPKAKLTVDQVPVRCRCQSCGNEFRVDSPLFICPSCQSGSVELLSGRGMILTRIIADEE